MFFLLLLLPLTSCLLLDRDTPSLTPLAYQDGDFLIGGIFNIGRQTEGACSYHKSTVYELQKGLLLRDIVEKYQGRFSALNSTVGYVIYDSCDSFDTVTQAAVQLSTNPKVVGVSSVDKKDLMVRSASITASLGIPTFIYMYADEALLAPEQHRMLFSMLETKESEARAIIMLLRQLDYKYIDIWYHRFSKLTAEYVYDNYLSVVGCGRITEVSNTGQVSRVTATYNETSVVPSQVQLILQNSATTSRRLLESLVEEMNMTNNIFIFGVSSGREKYIHSYENIAMREGWNNTILYPLHPLFRDTAYLDSELRGDWIRQGPEKLDTLYREVQQRKCSGSGVVACKTTSWLPFVQAGVEMLLSSLVEILENTNLTQQMGLGELRDKVLGKVLEDDRHVEVKLENSDLSISFTNRSLHVSYEIESSTMTSNTTTISSAGLVYPNSSLHLHLDILESLAYQRVCHRDCVPGEHLQYEEGMKQLTCCWFCHECDHNRVSNRVNADTCTQCAANETSQQDNTVCVQTEVHFIKAGSNIFLGGLVTMFLGMISVLVVTILILKHEDRPIIKASDPGYLYVILFSILLGMGTSFLPLCRRPNLATCTMEYVGVVLFATIISANLFWKCIKIYTIFISSNSFRQLNKLEKLFIKKQGHVTLNLVSVLFVMLFIVIGIFTEVDWGWKFDLLQMTNHSPQYPVCFMKIEQNNGVFLITLLPLILPTIYYIATLILAFKMRKFPHNFRETLNIFAATLIALFCSIIFLSGYSLAHLYLRGLLRTITVFITSLSFLLCLFVPKIIILLKKNVDVEEEKAIIKASVQKFSERSLSTNGAGYSQLSVRGPKASSSNL